MPTLDRSENVYVLDSLDEVPAIVSRMRAYGRDIGFDIETVSTNPIKDKIVALQFKPKVKKAAIIDVRHFSKSDLRMLGSMLEPLFDGSVTLVGQNLKFDLEFGIAEFLRHLCVAGVILHIILFHFQVQLDHDGLLRLGLVVGQGVSGPQDVAGQVSHLRCH